MLPIRNQSDYWIWIQNSLQYIKYTLCRDKYVLNKIIYKIHNHHNPIQPEFYLFLGSRNCDWRAKKTRNSHRFLSCPAVTQPQVLIMPSCRPAIGTYLDQLSLSCRSISCSDLTQPQVLIITSYHIAMGSLHSMAFIMPGYHPAIGSYIAKVSPIDFLKCQAVTQKRVLILPSCHPAKDYL